MEITTQRLVELTKTMVSIPSVTNQEEAISDWAYETFRHIGLRDVQHLPVEESGDSVIGWWPGTGEGPTLMFNFHLDTFPVCQGWSRDPFSPWEVEGRLYGLGVHDMKAGGACALAAAEALIASGRELRGTLIVSATTDEENWSRGAHALIRSGLLENCDYCLIPEPTAPATMNIGARGRHVIRIDLRGRATHAAYLGGGINAVVDGAKVIAELEHIDVGYDQRFDMPGSLCVIRFEGGTGLIIVPEQARILVDRHILPGQTVKEAMAQIEAAIHRAGIESAWEISADNRPTPAPTSYLVDEESPFVRKVKAAIEGQLGREVRLTLGRSVADTNHFAVYGGIPTLVYGPEGGNTCQADEYIEIESLPVVARTYYDSTVALLAQKGADDGTNYLSEGDQPRARVLEISGLHGCDPGAYRNRCCPAGIGVGRASGCAPAARWS